MTGAVLDRPATGADASVTSQAVTVGQLTAPSAPAGWQSTPSLTEDEVTRLLPYLEQRIDKSGGPNACWPWAGQRHLGYGRAEFIGSDGRRRRKAAHRVYFEATVRTLASDEQLDHLCEFRPCCNTRHLEPCTGRVNTLRSTKAPTAINARKTHCIHGHPLDGANLYRHRGHRLCIACRRIRDATRPRRHKAATVRGGAADVGQSRSIAGASSTTISGQSAGR